MKVDLDVHEMYWLLDRCLNGSHNSSPTIERFVDEWYSLMTEHDRMSIFEWAVRISYAWVDTRCFKPTPPCCGKDKLFMCRYHPENQYEVTATWEYVREGKKHRNTDTFRAFLMDGRYWINSRKPIPEKYIVQVKHLEFPKWKEYKQNNVDYNKNIL